MTMQRRHFELIASTIAAAQVSDQCRETMATAFADACARCNANFDRARFLRACDVPDSL